MSTSTVASVSCWVKDVVRTKSLNPPNPILQSLPSAEAVLDSMPMDPRTDCKEPTKRDAPIPLLPRFSVLQPHHLEKAAEEIRRQYDVELAQLEVRLTSVQGEDGSDGGKRTARNRSALSALLLDMDRLTAPIAHLSAVSNLYATLAAPPDRIDDWSRASDVADSSTTRRFLEQLYRSGIVYKALVSALDETGTGTKSPSVLVPFHKRGAHTGTGTHGPSGDSDSDSDNEPYLEDAERFQQIQDELCVLNERLGNIASYERASKAMRLQCMSDMYNCIGLTRMQAESLTQNASVWELARLQHNHMVASPHDELTSKLFPEIALFLEPFLPTKTKLDLEGVGAFLESKSEVANKYSSQISVEAQKASMKARFDFKQRMRLHGVMEGLIDFCDGILGISVVEDDTAFGAEAGWSKNVRLLHIYQKHATGSTAEGEETANSDDNKGRYLGTIYFDPFADSYWRTEDAKELVTTKLFSEQLTGQTIAPVAIMALKITPIWDDTPVPMTWTDTRDFLYQFGTALQLILTQDCRRNNHHTHTNDVMIDPVPIDTSEFLGHFMEMWIQNDGFLNRLAQLSQDDLLLEDDTLKVLRKDIKKEKALEIMNTMFLSRLQFTVFDGFDPRGDETLVALQERLATQYLPKSNLPDPSDLSPLLAIFQQSGLDQTMSAYGTLWSEVLAATVYEKFQNTDLRDRKEVERLGTGIRDLFLCGSTEDSTQHLSKKDFEQLCGMKEVSGECLKRVFGFDTKDDQEQDVP